MPAKIIKPSPIVSDFPESVYTGKRICLVGGKLQGVEAAYLAKKAGLYVILIDKVPTALAQSLCDEFHCFDITEDKSRFISLSAESDYMIPVNENEKTIAFLKAVQSEIKCTLLFDFDAYEISCDKSKSKEYFRKINIPTPADRPAEPPYFVKPPGESGSVGARIIETDRDLESVPAGYLVEEYVTGPVISLEVVGNGKDYTVIKETYIHIDNVYDCFMVTPLPYDETYRKIAYDLAKGLQLKGIMDVEAIAGPRGWKVLEIDARFPSQTPICVYFSSGVNLLLLLIESFSNTETFSPEGLIHSLNLKYADSYCIFEHFQKKNGELISGGEHLISAGNDFHPFAAGQAGQAGQANQAGQAGQANQAGQAEQGLEIFECLGSDSGPAYTVISYGKTKNEAESKKKKAEALILSQK